MSSKVIAELKEIHSINKEIKRLSNELKTLKTRKTDVERNVLKYLHKENKQCVQYEDIVVMTKEKKSRLRKSKDERNEDGSSVLEQLGITNPQDVLINILDAMKGEQIIKHAIQIKDNGSKI